MSGEGGREETALIRARCFSVITLLSVKQRRHLGKKGRGGVVSEAVAEALWTFREECIFLQQMFLVLHMVETGGKRSLKLGLDGH